MPWHPGILLKETAVTCRSLRREWAFAALSVMLLAFGVGLSSAVFTLLWQAIYAQLPVPDAARILTFSSNVTHNGRSDSDAKAQTFSVPMYRYLSQHWKASQGIIARHGELINAETMAGPQHVLADFVTGNFFGVLGVKPAIGRLFRETDDLRSNERRTVVLSYDFWQEAYGGQANAWNMVLRVNGVPFYVVGVTPPGFGGLVAGQSPKLYLPVSAFADVNPGWHGYDDWNLRWLNAFVRLPEKVTQSAAEAELQPVYRAAVREELQTQARQSADYLRELSHERLSLVPAAQGAHAMFDQWNEPLRVLQWMTLALLFLAAVNVAGLMLVRGMKRKQEWLIRYAVGATTPDVVRLQFQETLLLACVGGAVGLWIAHYGAELLVYLAHMGQRSAFEYGPHGWTLAVHWIAVLATGWIVGLFPAWQAAQVDLAAGLQEGALTHSATKSQALTRRVLAGAQIALSLVLVIAAGFFGKVLHKLVSVPVGFQAEHLTAFSVDAKLANSLLESTEVLWANIARRLQETPDVQEVTYGTGGPFPQGADTAVVIPGTSVAERSHHQSGIRSIIGPHYFSTFGIPLVAGREFDQRDRANTPDTVILNQTMARKLFGNRNPLGQTVTVFNGLDPNWLASVVGVVADHHQSWKRANASLVYTPAQQARRITDITYYVRTTAPSLSEGTIRQIMRQEAPALGSYDIATMHSRMAAFASGNRTMAVLVGAFALFALLIAGVGIYGVVSYSASLRTLEFAVRLSVGATPWSIAGLVLREVLVMVTGGLLCGVPLAYATLRIIRHQLEGLSLFEPGIYGAATLMLILFALLAAWIPVQRTKRISVHNALRYQ